MISSRKFPSPLKRKDREREEQEDETIYMTGIDLPRIIRVDSLAGSEFGQPEKKHFCFRCIISHDGRFKILWDWVVLLLVIFTAILIPFHAAFSTNQEIILDLIDDPEVKPMVILSLIVDLMFILDIFINFRTTYIDSSSDEMIREPKLLAIHYLKTWFVIDLLAAIPFDWIFFKKNERPETSTLIGLLKSARLLRLFRVARRIDRYSEYGLAVFFLLMSLFTLISHWLACGWNFIATQEEDNPNSWVRKMDEVLNGEWNGTIKMTISQRYVSSLYFIISSLTSVGFGNVAATTETEQVYSVVVMLLGALMYACIFGNMVAIVQRLYAKASSYHTQMNTIREFMKFYKIPEGIRSSIINYVRREWSTSNGVDIETVLQRFPDCIQADLTYELYQGVFRNAVPFREASISCMRALAMKFKTIILQQNHFALRQGEEIKRLYILGKGSLEVLVDGELKAILVKNAIFGYDFVQKPRRSKSNSDVRAKSLLELHYIHKDDMIEVLRMYPNFANTFCRTLKLGYDLNDEMEEGHHRNFDNQNKLHISAIAKSALSMPIMARFTKSFTKKAGSFTESTDNVYTNQRHSQNVVTPTEAGMSNGHCHFVAPPQNEVEVTKKISVNSVRFFNVELDKDTDNKERTSGDSSSLHTFENRLNVIESEVAHLQTDIDDKMNRIISILTAMSRSGASPNLNDYVLRFGNDNEGIVDTKL